MEFYRLYNQRLSMRPSSYASSQHLVSECRARLALVILAPTTLRLSILVLPLFSATMVHQFSWYCTPLQLRWYIIVISLDHPFHVYIEGIVPYRIDRVLILVVRFNNYAPGPSTALSLI